MTPFKHYGHFNFLRLLEIPEIQSTIVEIEHEPTGAKILQIANEDEENVFNLSFSTYPSTSNGVAHILEHTVLCGSKKFPVRDPFFSMSRRSLNTFMNALTGPDFTCYPAATLVTKDFYNLLEVYLDAVFHPILSKESFLQEGHRLEFFKANDPTTPLTFKGIVFNEMKGSLANADSRLSETVMEALFPDLTYGINSGGNPMDILTLTYDELKLFHATYYHPSRCLFYFYGNLPIERHLDFLEEHAFKGVTKLPPLPLLPKQPRFKAPKIKEGLYPLAENGANEDKAMVALSWLTCSQLEQEEVLALTILDVVLTGTDAAPLKKALLKSELCKQADSLIEVEMTEIPFIVFCKGCKAESAASIEELVRSTLKEIAEEGIPQNLIEAAIHQIEMMRTEITGNSSPYGLALFWRSALLKQHGGNPEDGLKVHTLFFTLEERIKDPAYFSQLIKKYFLDNPHFVRVVLAPSTTLAQQENEIELKKLEAIQAKLTPEEIETIVKEAEELEKLQESKESAINLLPKVTLKDVSPKVKDYSLHQESAGNLEVFSHSCFTNGLTYVDLVYDLASIEVEDLPYLRLFTLLLPQMGAGGRGYGENLEYMLEHTGGLSLSLDLFPQAESVEHLRPSVIFRGKALNRKLDKLFPLLKEMLLSADMTDVARIKELLMQHLLGLENSIQHSSLRYAVNLAAQGFSSAATIHSAWYGLDYYRALKNIVKDFENKPHALVEKLQTLQKDILGLKSGELVLSTEPSCYEALKKEGFFGLTELPGRSFTPWNGKCPVEKITSQGRINSSPVAFTAQAFASVPYTHPHAAALSIGAEIMSNKTLHKKIREQGGAYGSGAVNGITSEHFYLYSYRDPHLKSTLKAFQEAVVALTNKKFQAKDIEEAKLGLFQELDAPIAPGSRAMTAYSRLRGGRTHELRQHFRNRLLNCTKEQIALAAQEVLLPGLENSVTVTFANKEFLEKENKRLEHPFPLYPI